MKYIDISKLRENNTIGGGGGAKPYPKEETKEIYKKEASAYTQYLRSSWSTKDGGESH